MSVIIVCLFTSQVWEILGLTPAKHHHDGVGATCRFMSRFSSAENQNWKCLKAHTTPPLVGNTQKKKYRVKYFKFNCCAFCYKWWRWQKSEKYLYIQSNLFSQIIFHFGIIYVCECVFHDIKPTRGVFMPHVLQQKVVVVCSSNNFVLFWFTQYICLVHVAYSYVLCYVVFMLLCSHKMLQYCGDVFLRFVSLSLPHFKSIKVTLYAN